MIVPPTPGVLSALGLLLADVEHEQSRTFRSVLTDAEPAALDAVFADLDATCEARMQREEAPNVAISHMAELRYVRQSYELEVALPAGALTPEALATAAQDFHKLHERVYGFALPASPVELVTLRTVHTAHLVKPTLLGGLRGASAPAEPVGTRSAYFEEIGAYEPVPIYARTSLKIDQEIQGPAILEQADTTTVVCPGQSIRLDENGNVLLTVGDMLQPAAAVGAREVADVS